MPFVRRTRATFLSAELGFFGVEVKTRTQTPRFCGDPCRAGLSVLDRSFSRPTRTSWLTVGTEPPLPGVDASGGGPYGKLAPQDNLPILSAVPGKSSPAERGDPSVRGFAGRQPLDRAGFEVGGGGGGHPAFGAAEAGQSLLDVPAFTIDDVVAAHDAIQGRP